MEFKSPGFLVGEGRSGTTLLSAILNRHPRMCVTPETHFFRLLFSYPGGLAEFEANWPRSLHEIVSRMESTPNWKPDADQWLAHIGPDSRSKFPGYAALFYRLGEDIAADRQKSLWIEKTPPHILNLPLIRELYPDAPIIHLVRDGRDVADSLSHMHWTVNSRLPYLLRWRYKVSIARQFLAGDLHAFSLLYEDLIANPKAEVSRLCNFLGVTYFDSLLVPDGSENSLIELGQAHKEMIKQPISTKNVARWRTTYSSEDLCIADSLIGTELAAWKYPVTRGINAQRKRAYVTHQIAREDQRETFSQLVAKVFLANPTLQVTSQVSFFDPNELELPALWLTAEPLPPSDVKSSLGGGLLQLLRLEKRLRRLDNLQLIYMYHGELEVSSSWPLRRILERRVAHRARWVACPVKKSELSTIAAFLKVDPRKVCSVADVSVSNLRINLGDRLRDV